MRVSDDRYSRDRLRFDLAVRMIRHEARTSTIRAWTGLSDDRIRKLYRDYLKSLPSGPLRRHRGRSPRQTSYFLRSPVVRQEATALAGLLCLLGLVPTDGSKADGRPLHVTAEFGELFCQTYEAFLELSASPRISFEHAWFLLLSLLDQQDLRLDKCERCGSLYLHDPLAAPEVACVDCTRQAPPVRRRHKKTASGAIPTHNSLGPAALTDLR